MGQLYWVRYVNSIGCETSDIISFEGLQRLVRNVEAKVLDVVKL